MEIISLVYRSSFRNQTLTVINFGRNYVLLNIWMDVEYLGQIQDISSWLAFSSLTSEHVIETILFYLDIFMMYEVCPEKVQPLLT